MPPEPKRVVIRSQTQIKPPEPKRVVVDQVTTQIMPTELQLSFMTGQVMTLEVV